MDSKSMAENIATQMREQDDHVKALKAVLRRELGSLQLAILESKVQDEIARVRSLPSYEESRAQFQRELVGARDDKTLISLLYSAGPAQSNVGP